MADLKDLLKDFSNIEKDIKRTLNNRLLLKDIARTLTKEIKKRIQDGYGIDNTTNKLKKFKVLKQSTIKYREKQKEKGKLDKRTRPSQSNQIETGKFIDGIYYKNNKKEIIISPSRDRIEMVKGQLSQGRNGLDLSEDDLDDILKYMSDEIHKIIYRNLKG